MPVINLDGVGVGGWIGVCVVRRRHMAVTQIGVAFGAMRFIMARTHPISVGKVLLSEFV